MMYKKRWLQLTGLQHLNAMLTLTALPKGFLFFCFPTRQRKYFPHPRTPRIMLYIYKTVSVCFCLFPFRVS